MDQLRVALAWMQKHHFWLLSGLSVVLALAGWYLGTGTLAEAYKKDSGTINSAFSEIETKANRPFHPNESVNTAQKAEVSKLLDEVRATWNALYERQRERVLKWPPQLNEQFQNYIAALKFGESIRTDMREQYTNYIEGRFADLPKIIDANPIDPATATGGGEGFSRGAFGRGEIGGGEYGGVGAGFRPGATGEEAVEEDYMVLWVDQDRVQAELTWPERGSSWRIWATQEDLWVYETLLRAVAATNEAKEADRRATAAVRSIFGLQVGQLAAKESRGKGRVTPLAAPSTGAEGDMTFSESVVEGEMSQDFAGVEFSEEGGGTGPSGDAAEKALFLSGRYIDSAGKPIPVPADEEPLDLALFGTEFKRLPVRLDLEMDQRWLSYLIVQLANAPLQIEIQEVRINPDESSASGGEYGGGRGFTGGGEYGFARHNSYGSGEASIEVFTRQPFIKRVVLQGVVYIFNRPDESKLQLDASGEPTDTATAAL